MSAKIRKGPNTVVHYKGEPEKLGIIIDVKHANRLPYHITDVQVKWDNGVTQWLPAGKVRSVSAC